MAGGPAGSRPQRYAWPAATEQGACSGLRTCSRRRRRAPWQDFVGRGLGDLSPEERLAFYEGARLDPARLTADDPRGTDPVYHADLAIEWPWMAKALQVLHERLPGWACHGEHAAHRRLPAAGGPGCPEAGHHQVPVSQLEP